jgi:hypothetical protein
VLYSDRLLDPALYPSTLPVIQRESAILANSLPVRITFSPFAITKGFVHPEKYRVKLGFVSNDESGSIMKLAFRFVERADFNAVKTSTEVSHPELLPFLIVTMPFVCSPGIGDIVRLSRRFPKGECPTWALLSTSFAGLKELPDAEFNGLIVNQRQISEYLRDPNPGPELLRD